MGSKCQWVTVNLRHCLVLECYSKPSRRRGADLKLGIVPGRRWPPIARGGRTRTSKELQSKVASGRHAVGTLVSNEVAWCLMVTLTSRPLSAQEIGAQRTSVGARSRPSETCKNGREEEGTFESRLRAPSTWLEGLSTATVTGRQGPERVIDTDSSLFQVRPRPPPRRHNLCSTPIPSR